MPAIMEGSMPMCFSMLGSMPMCISMQGSTTPPIMPALMEGSMPVGHVLRDLLGHPHLAALELVLGTDLLSLLGL
eukprot:5290201-Alexandrium_andersonii.AAC.1